MRGVGEKEKSLAGMDSVISLSLLFLSSLHFAARADLGLFLLSIRGSLVSSINSSLLTLRSSSRLKIRVDSNRQSFSLCLLSRVPQSSSAPITEHSFPPLPFPLLVFIQLLHGPDRLTSKSNPRLLPLIRPRPPRRRTLLLRMASLLTKLVHQTSEQRESFWRRARE